MKPVHCLHHCLLDASLRGAIFQQTIRTKHSPPSLTLLTIHAEVPPAKRMISKNLQSETSSSQQVMHQHNSTDCETLGENNYQDSSGRRFKSFWTYPVYHRLSTFVVITNMVTILSLSLKRRLSNNPQTCLEGVFTALLISILVRQELIVNALYWSFGQIPHSVPLRIRRHAAHLYHLGGIHSGAAVAASLWLITFNIAVVRELAKSSTTSAAINIATIVIAGVLDLTLLIMVLSSLPKLRENYHNLWECTHRFSGWFLIIVSWSYLFYRFVYLSRMADRSESSSTELSFLNPVPYLLLVITASVFYPWTIGHRLKKVVPRYEKLSNHAIQLHFDDWHIEPCKTQRYSTSPMSEWHAFAAISTPDGKGHSVIISHAGDWTAGIINNPPKELWVRGLPMQGVLYMAKVFKSVLCVGTGSGIAPILGLLEISGTRFKVLWSARDPENTYSPAIVCRVLQADPENLVIDTAKHGRPNLVEYATRIYRVGGIEAIFVISNAKTTKKTVQSLRARNIPTYGPIFDS